MRHHFNLFQKSGEQNYRSINSLITFGPERDITSDIRRLGNKPVATPAPAVTGTTDRVTDLAFCGQTEISVNVNGHVPSDINVQSKGSEARHSNKATQLS